MLVENGIQKLKMQTPSYLKGVLFRGCQSLPPSPPLLIPLALLASSLCSTGFLPLCHSQPTAKHLKPQDPEANDCSRLLGFRTGPQIHPYSKSPHQNVQSWRKIQGVSAGAAYESPG